MQDVGDAGGKNRAGELAGAQRLVHWPPDAVAHQVEADVGCCWGEEGLGELEDGPEVVAGVLEAGGVDAGEAGAGAAGAAVEPAL